MAQEYRAYLFESNPVVGIKEQGKDCVAGGLCGKGLCGHGRLACAAKRARPLAGSGLEAGASVLPKSDQRPPQLCPGLIESWAGFRAQECPRPTVKFEVDESLP